MWADLSSLKAWVGILFNNVDFKSLQHKKNWNKTKWKKIHLLLSNNFVSRASVWRGFNSDFTCGQFQLPKGVPQAPGWLGAVFIILDHIFFFNKNDWPTEIITSLMKLLYFPVEHPNQ